VDVTGLPAWRAQQLWCAAAAVGDTAAAGRLWWSLRPLVLKVSYRWIVTAQQAGVPVELHAVEDMAAFVSIWLITSAVRKYDPSKGRVSTYFVRWCNAACRLWLADHGRAVRLPTALINARSRIMKVRARWLRDFGIEPTDAQLCIEAMVSPDRLRRVRETFQRALELDARVGCDDDRSRSDVFMDVDPGCHDGDLAAEDSEAFVSRALASLEKRERYVLVQRFSKDRTLSEIGVKLGISRERVRQLEARALDKLRRLTQRQGLVASDFFEAA
jgi:RNA polymerase sigma factor (sigma-70 family)